MRALLLSLFALWALPAYAQTAHIGTFEWTIDDPRFGGFSAIELDGDGQTFIAISDRGTLFSGQIGRRNDAIQTIAVENIVTLRGAFGIPFNRPFSDSEGIALAPDGTFHIAFEWTHGVRRFESVTARPGDLMTTPHFDTLQSNASLEAIAVGPDGALYIIPERSGLPTRPFPVFRQLNGAWDQPFTIPRTGPFLVTGADVGPDNKLYVLERDFVGIGFRSRVRRFDLDGKNEELLLTTGLRTHDNLEGIAVWQDEQGLRMTLISDDNFRSLQSTQLVEYRLTGQ